MTTETGRRVLYVEDDEADVLLFKRALMRVGGDLPLEVVADGEAAWTRLTACGDLPSLILLDLKLPRKSGIEILEGLKRHEVLRRIPVIVMTSSRERIDVDRVYGLGADFYLTKRVDAEGHMELARAIHAYWKAVAGDPDHLGSDPSLSRLRKLAERPE